MLDANTPISNNLQTSFQGGDTYRTKDLAEAGALIVCKQRLLEIERIGQICWFIFAKATRCRNISDKFFFGNLLVNAKQYHESLSLLKNRIFTYEK